MVRKETHLFNFSFVQFLSFQKEPKPRNVEFHLIIIIIDENRLNFFEK